MSAYATPKRASLHPERLHSVPVPTASQHAAAGSPFSLPMSDGAQLIDVLVDQLAERIAAAVTERLGAASVKSTPEWMDSREAAVYLGVHRDTLRKLA